MHTFRRRLGRALVSAVFVLGAVLLGFSWWILAYSGISTVDQILANMEGAGGDGAGGTLIVVSGVVGAVTVPLVIASVVLFAVRRINASAWKESLPARMSAAVSAATGIVLAAVPIGGIVAISTVLSLPQYVASIMSDQSLTDYYATATVTSTPSGTPPNLVIIYMESVEDALSDASIFERDMLAPIEAATDGWSSVTLTQPANGGWTLGGIVNTQCGFPLRMSDTSLVGDEINVVGRDVEEYLPRATCLGDVLEDQGYRSVFLGGANTSFAGKGDFLADHGYDTVLGRKQWIARGETELREDWGLSDRRLMARAKEMVTELHESGEPFNLTLLTLDTHPEDHVYAYCDVDSEQELTSIYECSMQQVASFVDYMDANGYLDDTVVVVMGDHLRLMGSNNSFRDQLEEIPDRTIFNRIWIPDGLDIAVNQIDQFSMFPTILEIMGFELENGRAGIGVSALEADPGAGTVRDLPDQVLDSLVQSRSQDFYDYMWDVEP